MQTYKTVAEIVDFLETYHRQLRDYYLKHRDTVNSERLQMLLDYISRHEKNIQDVLTTIQEKDRDIILKTWIQYVPFNESNPDRRTIDRSEPGYRYRGATGI